MKQMAVISNTRLNKR